MSGLDLEEQEYDRFLQKIRNGADPTWGYYVYASYTFQPEQPTTDAKSDEEKAEKHFQAVLKKLRAHVVDKLRYSYPAPYNQELIDTLRLEPATRLPGASLADVCTHFREHYAVDWAKVPESEYQELLDLKAMPKYDWCIVIDDKVLQSIENGPEPIGPVPPEGVKSFMLAYQANTVFVKLLEKSYITMEKPKLLAAQGRGGTGRRIEWEGWFKFSPVDLMPVYRETDSGDIETHFKGPDEILEI